MREVVIVSAVRSAVGKGHKGSLKDTRPDDLLGQVLKAAVERAKVNPNDIGDVVIGTATPEAEQGMNMARTAGFLAGLPDTVPAITINRFCSSGLQSLAQGASAILAGWQDVVLTGGVESMSLLPMGGDRPSPNPDLMRERPGVYTPMGITAENVANRFSVSREDQDAFAVRSHERALSAQAEGKFDDEIVPIQTKVWVDGAWKEIEHRVDEGPRQGSTVEVLGKLRPAFSKTGSVTAGNSSQISDGAAATVAASREYAEANGLPILGILKSYQVVGVEPEIMGIGPAVAIPAALEKAGIQLEDVGLFEINEAFASQAVYCVRELGIDLDKVNVNGGAIALGHPLGCTGAKLTATLLHEMRRQGVRYGVVSMCIGGGMGAAAVFENPDA
ncbi:MAG: thiolase family protein [Deltaproteobacteria bacterium]|nr:MAG: thiolase family protein [Deltaproteobacteria bacterium]